MYTIKHFCTNTPPSFLYNMYECIHIYVSFISCILIDFFRGNQPLKSNIHIPTFYSDIHDVYINNFMKEPFNTLQILKQPLWFNSHISSNPDIMYITKWYIKRINQIKDIIDKNGNFLSHKQLKEKYDITTPFLTTLQLLISSIPIWWKNKLKTFTTNTNCILVGNSINVNNKVLNIEKINCKDFYWHLINKASHMPNNILKWCETYHYFKNADPKTWQTIFKLPFQVIRETRIQTFQYKILHKVIWCNKWLFNIKIKTSELCDYCNDIDDITHFFFHCPKVKIFWNSALKWLENISNLPLRNSPLLEECLIFGFPECNTVVKGKMSVINFCILYIKYYIYILKDYLITTN